MPAVCLYECQFTGDTPRLVQAESPRDAAIKLASAATRFLPWERVELQQAAPRRIPGARGHETVHIFSCILFDEKRYGFLIDLQVRDITSTVIV